MTTPQSEESGTGASSTSLQRTLRLIASRSGLDITPDDLNAALGLSVMVCAPREVRPLSWWPAFARNAFLPQAGRLWGMTVRDLHPPSAARGLDQCDEFLQHFEASYKPLIERALENGQPVIGWSFAGGNKNQPPLWHTIEQICDGGLVGCLPAAAGGASSPRPVPVSTPMQVYIVEAIEPVCPSPGSLIAAAFEGLRRCLGNEIDDEFAVVTGPKAYDSWLERLKEAAMASPIDPGLLYEHQALACVIGQSHESAVRFIDGHGADFGVLDQPLAATLREAFALVASIMRATCETELADHASMSHNELNALLRHIASARAAANTALTALLVHQSRQRP